MSKFNKEIKKISHSNDVTVKRDSDENRMRDILIQARFVIRGVTKTGIIRREKKGGRGRR